MYSGCCNLSAHHTVIQPTRQVLHSSFNNGKYQEEDLFMFHYYGQLLDNNQDDYSPRSIDSSTGWTMLTSDPLQEPFYSDLVNHVDSFMFPIHFQPFSRSDAPSIEDPVIYQTNGHLKHTLPLPSETIHSKPRKNTHPSQHQCMICFKTFSRSYNLKSHYKTHTKERPYKCLYPNCGWTFARPHDLKRHGFLHSGYKPFVCSCGKGFPRCDAFKRHQQVTPTCVTFKFSNK